jgi:hypothetical protein
MATPSPRFRSALVRALAAGVVAPLASGQPADPKVERPESAGRVVRTFDFEEHATNPDDVPQFWFRDQDNPAGARRPGFPAWNLAALRYTTEGATPFGGEGCVQLPTRGGSTSLLLGPGALPVFQNADYRVWSKVRTDGLTHARAFLVARFLTESGAPIPGSDRRSEPVLSEGQWTSVSVDLPGVYDHAAWIQLELQVLQPEQAGLIPPGPHRVWPQDFAGAASFDDVAVVQLPRVELTTSAPANIAVAPEPPELRLLVRDLAGEALDLTIEVRDLDGRQVDRWSARAGTGITQESWKPALPALGWYRADLTVASQAGQVGESHVEFVWVPPGAAAAGADRRRFGLTVDHLPDGIVGVLPEVARRAGVGAVTIPAWSADVTPESIAARAKRLGGLVTALLGDWQDVTASLPRVPDGLIRQVRADPTDTWGVLRTDPKVWRPFAFEIFDQLGQSVPRWQIGEIGDDRAFWHADLAAELQAQRAALGAMMPAPTIVIPTRLDREWPARWLRDNTGTIAFAAQVPFDMDARGVREAAAQWAAAVKDAGRPADLAAVFEPAPAGRYRGANAAAGFARQVVEFWAGLGEQRDARASAVTIAAHEPWIMDSARRPQAHPRAEYAVWRTLVDRLAGRHVLGTFPAAEGVVCYILAPAPGTPDSRGSALVAWNESALPEHAVLTAYLGEEPVRVVDIFGNERPAPAAAASNSRRKAGVRVPLTDSPVFIEGIDLPLVRFLSTMRFDPPRLDSINRDQERFIVVENPWPIGLAGRVTILEPGGLQTGAKDRAWRISPRSQPFVLAPGKTERLPVTVGFSAVEEAGIKEFVFEVELTAERSYAAVEVRRPVELGLPQLSVDLGYLLRGEDVVLEATISNSGSAPLTMNVTAFAPGLPRAKGVVRDLLAGRQTRRQFVFPGAAPALRGQRLVVHLADPDSGASISRSVLVK